MSIFDLLCSKPTIARLEVLYEIAKILIVNPEDLLKEDS